MIYNNGLPNEDKTMKFILKKSKFSKKLKKLEFLTIPAILMLFGILGMIAVKWSDGEQGTSASITTTIVSPSATASVSADSSVKESEDKDKCNIVVVDLYGELVSYLNAGDYNYDGDVIGDFTSSEDIIYGLIGVKEDPSKKGVLVSVNSSGGEPVAGEEIARALQNLDVPVVAVIRQVGASAAYWAASGADTIFASENSDVGSIGVALYLEDHTDKNKKEGVAYNVFTMGKYKSMGDPGRPMTEEEKKLINRDIKIVYDNFIKAVAQNRNLSETKVRQLADGATMLGELALKNGLVDYVGTMFDAEGYLSEKIGEKVVLCGL